MEQPTGTTVKTTVETTIHAPAQSPAQPPVVEQAAPNILLRILYLVFIGWWLGAIVSAIAWLFNVTVIGLPVGLYLINRLPTIITLRPSTQWRVEDGVLKQGAKQRPFLFRAVFFVLIGWWFSGLWLALAFLCLVTIIGIPLALLMYERAAAVTTLRRM